ncbi:hypothetical protein TIFTF001_008334 [Ficus carica]|uniref:PIG-P domain-containing protein n=1 Tax=Ficus carica TaxID=3494 RepID=A0AA87ZSC7_FICCA|nr:hypothetical protein TIFTF001_008334 [Ficus carica]
MEDSYSVSSPRRILSLSKKRRASVSFQDPDEKLSGFQLPGEHGPKTSEVYGFVGSITTVVATGPLYFFGNIGLSKHLIHPDCFLRAAIFLIWAYVPESWLHSVGIFYYPSRYWALAVPTYAMVTIVLALGFYIGLNFMSTPPPTSLNTIFDEFSREPSTFKLSKEGDENDQPIEPISDIGIDRINHLMFDDFNSK